MIDNNALLSEEEAAARLHLKPTTLAAWRHQKRGPKHFKIGRSCFYRDSDLASWIEAQAVIPKIPEITA
jgi:hypothetical protein